MDLDKKILQDFTMFIENKRIKKLNDSTTKKLAIRITNLYEKDKSLAEKYTEQAENNLIKNYKLILRKNYFDVFYSNILGDTEKSDRAKTRVQKLVYNLKTAFKFKDVFTQEYINELTPIVREDVAIKITRSVFDYIKQIDLKISNTSNQKTLVFLKNKKLELVNNLIKFYQNEGFLNQDLPLFTVLPETNSEIEQILTSNSEKTRQIISKAYDTSYEIIEPYIPNTDGMELWIGVR